MWLFYPVWFCGDGPLRGARGWKENTEQPLRGFHGGCTEGHGAVVSAERARRLVRRWPFKFDFRLSGLPASPTIAEQPASPHRTSHASVALRAPSVRSRSGRSVVSFVYPNQTQTTARTLPC